MERAPLYRQPCRSSGPTASEALRFNAVLVYMPWQVHASMGRQSAAADGNSVTQCYHGAATSSSHSRVTVYTSHMQWQRAYNASKKRSRQPTHPKATLMLPATLLLQANLLLCSVAKTTSSHRLTLHNAIGKPATVLRSPTPHQVCSNGALPGQRHSQTQRTAVHHTVQDDLCKLQ